MVRPIWLLGAEMYFCIRARISLIFISLIAIFSITANAEPLLFQRTYFFSNDAPATASKHLIFEVATVRPTDPHATTWKLQFIANGFTARNVSLRVLIQEAYGTYDEDRLLGGPEWLSQSKFDIEAKLNVNETHEFSTLTLDQRRSMLQALLADRFQLKIHRESKESRVYLLTAIRNKRKLQESNQAGSSRGQIKGLDALITRSSKGILEGQNITMPGLAFLISQQVGRVIVDKTGLKGHYDIALHWTPDELATSTANYGTDMIGPSIFTAVREQLGLNLAASKAPVEVIVVDAAKKPSEN